MRKLFSLFAAVLMAVSVMGVTYTKVTSAPADWSGEYVIAAKVGDDVRVFTGVDAASNYVVATLNSDGKITNDGLITVTIAQKDGGYSIKVNGGANDGKFLSSGTTGASYSNGLKFTNEYQIDFAFANNAVEMTQTIASGTDAGKKMYLLYNNSSSNWRFRFFKETNFGNSNYITPILYKKDAAAGIKVTGVTLDKTSASINVGETTTLVQTVAPDNADDKTVTWSSSNEDVATVANGVVTGVGEGSATITVKTNDGNFTATCTVNVTAVAVTGVTLDQTSLSLMVNKKATLVATVLPENAANQNVTWTSNNEAVAKVADGVVTAVAEGNATITVTTIDGGFTATCAVTVTPYVEPDEIELVFAANSTNSDSGASWTTSSTISNVFSDGADYVSEIAAVDRVYPARNSLVNGVKFGTSSAAGTITLTLSKTFNVSKIIVTAAPYGDSEGKQGFDLNGVAVAMKDGVNKKYADYDVNITGEVSSITLAQHTASSGRIYVEKITIVKATTPDPIYTEAEATFAAQNEDGYWATFSSENVTFWPKNDVVVYAVALQEEELVMIDLDEDIVEIGEDLVEGYYVPANNGVLVNSVETSATYYDVENVEVEDIDPELNLLYPASTDKAELAGHKFYKLAYGDAQLTSATLGFYWGAADGGAFTSREGSAYLAVPADAAAPARFLFNSTEEVTALENVAAVEGISKKVVNGRLFILRDGKTFDVVGRIVK